MQLPCSSCPFRSDRPFRGLTEKRAEEIVQVLHRDGSFHCHQTCDYSQDDGDDRITEKSKLCVGAAIFLENTRRGGMLANLAFRFGYITGEISPKTLSCIVPVYQTIEDFIDGASS